MAGSLDRPLRTEQGSLKVTVGEEVSQLLCSPDVAQRVAAWQKAVFKEQRGSLGDLLPWDLL